MQADAWKQDNRFARGGGGHLYSEVDIMLEYGP